MSVNKFNFLFRESNFNNFDELCAYLKPLVNQYYEFLILDEKPEKGERKIADEQIILIAQIIDQYIENSDDENKFLDIFKIVFLE